LSSTLSATGSFASASNKGTYTGYGANAGSYTDSGEIVGSGSSPETPMSIPALASTFDLAALTTSIDKVTGDTSLVATATVALPEPSGVAAAFAGIPCFAGLLGFARRLRNRDVV